MQSDAMTTTRRILVLVDPDANSRPGVGRAVWLALKLGASLKLLVCSYDQFVANDDRARESLMNSHRDFLRQMAESLTSNGIPVSTDVCWDKSPHECISRKASEIKPLIVIKDTHYHSILKRSLLSTTDWKLVEHCPAPLLLVKDRPLSAQIRVLAAVDPMHQHDKPEQFDHELLTFAHRWCESIRGELHAVHVFDTAAVYASSALAGPVVGGAIALQAENVKSVENHHRERFDALMQSGCIEEPYAHFVRGDPVIDVVSVADEISADFVVMGVMPRSGLHRLVIGHTAERVLDHLPCDLVVVKPATS